MRCHGQAPMHVPTQVRPHWNWSAFWRPVRQVLPWLPLLFCVGLILGCVLAMAGCGTALLGDQSRYRVITGPASLAVTNLWGGTGSIEIEEGGRVLFGPDLPEFYDDQTPVETDDGTTTLREYLDEAVERSRDQLERNRAAADAAVTPGP